jgi:uncharacterized SAM-binding protein YcdF (DUF218 family)
MFVSAITFILTNLLHPYRSWNRSWLTWLLTNVFGASGTILYARATSAGLGYPAGICVAAAAGPLLLLPAIWFVLGGVLPNRRQGWRLFVFWGAIVATYVSTGLLLSGLGGFFGIIALFTGWPYLPAALVGATLACRKWLFRGNDGKNPVLALATSA